MKALVMRGPGQFGVEEVPKPVCGDREVLVQVQAVAICGSDPVLLAGGSLSDGLPGSLPHIAGHEGAGIIVEEAMAIQPGDPYGDNYMRIALETLEYMVQHAPKDIKVNPPICMAPFTVCAQLCGIGDFCANTLEDPDMVQAMLDVATETCIRYMKACEKVMDGPLHHLLLSDDLSSFLMIKIHKKPGNWKKRIDNHYKCFYNVVVRVNTYAQSAWNRLDRVAIRSDKSIHHYFFKGLCIRMHKLTTTKSNKSVGILPDHLGGNKEDTERWKSHGNAAGPYCWGRCCFWDCAPAAGSRRQM